MADQNHHFVPQLYLRGFLDATLVARGRHQLWRYRPGEKPVAKGPKGVAKEFMFYATPETPGHENDTEVVLAKIEETAAPHLQKLRDGDVGLSAQERSELASFIAVSLTRTAAYREMINATTIGVFRLGTQKLLATEGEFDRVLDATCAEMGISRSAVDTKAIRKQLAGIVSKQVEVTQSSKAWTVKEAFEHAMEHAPIFERLKWVLMEAPDGQAFITSDNPVLIVDPYVIKGPRRARFVYSSAMNLFFPVSSRFHLVGLLGPTADLKRLVRPEVVAGMNENQMRHAQKEIYTAFLSMDLQKQFEHLFATREPLFHEVPED